MKQLAIIFWLLPQILPAQTIMETMQAAIDELPPSAFEAPDDAIAMVIAMQDPDFTTTPSMTSPVATAASQLILPEGQRRWKFSRSVGARLLVRAYQPEQIAALILTQADYGRGCKSIAAASEALMSQDINDADQRVMLTLLTLTQAPTYYANTPQRLAAAYNRNVNDLAVSGYLTPEDTARLTRLGPVQIAANTGCNG